MAKRRDERPPSSKPATATEQKLGDAVADAFSGIKRKKPAVDELADRETGSPGPIKSS